MSDQATMGSFIRVNRPRTFMLLLGIPLAVCAGVYVAMRYPLKSKKKSQASIGEYGGQSVLQRLIGYRKTQSKLDKAETSLETLLRENTEKPDMFKLRRAVARLEVSGRRAKAAKMLVELIERAEKAGASHKVYEFEMLYVEMLIFMGDPKEALNQKCLKDHKITDARRPLFKAICNIMLGKVDEGKKHWEDFKDIWESLHLPYNILEDDELSDVVNNFVEFRRIVELLKHDIQNSKNIEAA